MHFAGVCSPTYSPSTTHIGFVAPWTFPPRRLPRRPHTSMRAFSRSSAYPEVSTISFKASFSVQPLTIQRPCPDLARPCNDSGSDSSMYVHYTYTACTFLMLVAQLTVHARRILSLYHLGPSGTSTSSPQIATSLATNSANVRIPGQYGVQARPSPAATLKFMSTTLDSSR